MLKPPMPGMTDTLEFVKNLWGGMNIPGAMPGMPSVPGLGNSGLSVEDLDKKIADLKTVEAWLNLNLGMLHGTIQALEIQRGTMATLKAMGESMAQAIGQSGAASEAAMAPFAQFFSQAAQAANAPKPASTPAAPPSSAPSSASSSASSSAPQQAASASAAGGEAPNAAMPAAVAWWNLLQEQFRQAVVSAMPADGGGAPDNPDKPAAARAAPPDPLAGDHPADTAGSAPPASRRGARSKADKA